MKVKGEGGKVKGEENFLTFSLKQSDDKSHFNRPPA
jgi:hypothetical protein